MSLNTAVHRICDTYDSQHSLDVAYLKHALETGLSGTSETVVEYERCIAEFYAYPHSLTVSSGTSSVAVALKAFDFDPGDEIIVPPTCPICTIFPILMHGLKPIFVDVLPDSFGLNPVELEKAVTPRTRAVIEVPMWGYPTQADRLRQCTNTFRIPLVMDLAHCHLTKLNNKWLADFGQVACFSTHESKFITTGEGGFVLTHDECLYDRMLSYSRFGNLDGKNVGVNFKLNGLQAAIGIARMGAVMKHREVRLTNRKYILDNISNPEVRELPIVEGGSINGYALLLQATRSDGRRLVEYMWNCGIPSDIRKYDNQPLYNYPLLAAYERACPNATKLLRSLTTIPLHPDLTRQELEQIIEAINAYET